MFCDNCHAQMIPTENDLPVDPVKRICAIYVLTTCRCTHSWSWTIMCSCTHVENAALRHRVCIRLTALVGCVCVVATKRLCKVSQWILRRCAENKLYSVVHIYRAFSKRSAQVSSTCMFSRAFRYVNECAWTMYAQLRCTMRQQAAHMVFAKYEEASRCDCIGERSPLPGKCSSRTKRRRCPA